MAESKFSWERRGLRFSLHSLIVLTAAVAAFFGGRATHEAAMREEKERIKLQMESFVRELAMANAKAGRLERELRNAKAAHTWERLSHAHRWEEPVLLNSPDAWRQLREP